MKLNVIQKDKKPVTMGIVLRVVSAVVITSMIIPLLFVDAFCSFYHAVYFRLNEIPLIPRKKYIIIDRGRLLKLNWVQRWNCIYCDYANGLIAWTKAVINTTEIYNCAIKHGSAEYNQEYQKDYFEYDSFR
jgi:hypothetical protein